jgi:hypothetical protein
MNRVFFVVFLACLLAGSLHAQFADSAKKAFDLVYSSRREMPEVEIQEIIRQVTSARFPAEGHRVIALMQVYAVTEDSENLIKARKVADAYIAKAEAGWMRDLIRIQLVFVLALEGKSEPSRELAEQILREIDDNVIATQDDPYLNYLWKRINLPTHELKVSYFRDNLLRHVGYSYLNRTSSEGGPDIKKAVEVFQKIENEDAWQSCFSDARVRDFRPHHWPLRKDPAKPVTSKAGRIFQGWGDSQSSSTPKAGDGLQPASDNPSLADSTVAWPVWALMVVSVIGLLVLVLKKRAWRV